MLSGSAFGPDFGWMTVVPGTLGIGAACRLLIAFHLVLRWKNYRLSSRVERIVNAHGYAETVRRTGSA